MKNIKIFKTIREWFSKRPATKATWITVVITGLTLIVVIFQSYISYRQTEIMEQQTRIAEAQSKLTSNQLELSTTPYVETRIENKTNQANASKIIVRNGGNFPVKNIKVSTLYFAKIVDHGWWVSAPTGGLKREELDSKESYEFDIGSHGKMLRAMPTSFSIEGNLEFAVFLISFERYFDGKAYLHLEPFEISDNELWSLKHPSINNVINVTGPLSRVCFPPIELTMEFLRRRPLPKVHELYNYDYPLDYAPTGCLGVIQWIN